MRHYVLRSVREFRGWVVSRGRWVWVESVGDKLYSFRLRQRWLLRRELDRVRALDELSGVLLVAAVVLGVLRLLVWLFVQ